MNATENYKLHNILKTMNKSEVRQFKRVLQSPFFVLRKDVGRLFNYLSKYHLKGKPFPQKEMVFQYVFEDQEFDYGLLRLAMSDLFKLIEEYLVIVHRRKDKIKTRHLLAEIYGRRNLGKCYQGALKKTQTLLENQPLRNAGYYRQLLDFQMEQRKFQMSSQRTKIFNLEELAETMDVSYMIEKLRLSCTQFTHQQVFKTEYDFGLLPHFLDMVEQERYLKIPAVAIYYYCYRFLTEQYSNEFFQKFKTLFFQHQDLFTHDEMSELYLFAINFCIRKINRGELEFNQEAFELYKGGLESGYFLEGGRLSRFTFNNVVASGIRMEEFTWLENFIQEYAEKLSDEYRVATVSFNLARIAYTRKNYGAAMLHLQNAEYKDLVNNLIAKTILLKIYYELEEYDSLFSHLDSFQIFIRRREVSDFHCTNYMNIIRFVKKIVGLPPSAKKERKALLEEIKEEKILTEKKWLLEKIAES